MIFFYSILLEKSVCLRKQSVWMFYTPITHMQFPYHILKCKHFSESENYVKYIYIHENHSACVS